MNKLRIGVFCGGQSAEHEVSLQSAKNIIAALDRNRFEPVIVSIDKAGTWRLVQPETFLENADDPSLIRLSAAGEAVSDHFALLRTLDVALPVLHGPLGEDGTIQGLFRVAGIPFVGSDVLGSAVSMDKDVAKRLLRDASLPVAPFRTVRKADMIDYEKLAVEFGLPCFVKPANMGSSVGVAKAVDLNSLQTAITEAFRFDDKILVEQAITGIEVECSILGNENPRASLPGTIVPQADFYSYEAKYIDEQGAAMQVPADLPQETVRRIQELSLQAFTTLECSGLARVDLFLTPEDELFINEINTLPGFTAISMYPKLWEASGIAYTELISKLIDLAVERHEKRQKLLILHS